MKITVLNGSPKGNLSVTMQYVSFIQKKFPHHELKILNIAFPDQKDRKRWKGVSRGDGCSKVFRRGFVGLSSLLSSRLLSI